MTATNFPAALAFVWRSGFDDPGDGYHVTPGDSGGGTFGGVIEATWAGAVSAGIVQGTLRDASVAQLTTVLRANFWGGTCDALPAGLDLALFNGRMMSGYFPRIFQQCLGLMGHDDVDGWIGPQSLALAKSRDPETFIGALAGAHAYYLSTLSAWPEFGDGWTARLKAAQVAAVALAGAAPVA